ncbi:MAG: hypothetical protein M1828_006332 [Chrysothrix sp. TS-e1954]|nr:MAG: hypothetical protein M1828_006332 [Chrysothrix sp. TS-e1954]
MTGPIPPSLSSYLVLPPQDTLVLVTDVISATSNWVLLRFIYAALKGHERQPLRAADDGSNVTAGGHDDTAVVLVSWMRDYILWRDTARRAVGLDLASLQNQGRFVFVDGLSTFFGADVAPDPVSAAAAAPKHAHLTSPTTEHIQSTISAAVTQLKALKPNSKILLMLDYPSILLETTLPPIKSAELTSMLLRLRPQVHSTIVSLPGDLPLMQAATADVPQASTPMETENAAFLVGCVHESRLVVGTRRLETGYASDVSGVVRCTKGGGSDLEAQDGTLDVKESEWLYYVGADLSVKVWTR